MNTRDTSSHPEDLLPWYVNGTLEGAEREAVARHLETCPRCRDEVAWLARLREQVKEAAPGATPGELGLRRLLREVEAEAPAPRRREWWRPALAAAVVVIVIQSVLLVRPWVDDGAGIVPLGGSRGGAVIQVEFRPQATEAQIREVLQAVEGTIVDGPGALGVYRVRLEGEGDQRRRLEEAVARLRARGDVVIHVAAD